MGKISTSGSSFQENILFEWWKLVPFPSLWISDSEFCTIYKATFQDSAWHDPFEAFTYRKNGSMLTEQKVWLFTAIILDNFGFIWWVDCMYSENPANIGIWIHPNFQWQWIWKRTYSAMLDQIRANTTKKTLLHVVDPMNLPSAKLAQRFWWVLQSCSKWWDSVYHIPLR